MRFLLRLTLFLSMTVASALSTVHAATYYVSTSGSDGNTGTTVETAWRTLQKAANSVAPGDVIEVLAGTYNGFTIGSRRGTSWNPGGFITMRPYNGATVTVQGDAGVGGVVSVQTPNCTASSNRSACYPSYWRIEGFDINATGVHYAVKFESGGLKLINNKIHDSNADVIKLVATSDDVEIDSNEIYNSGRADSNAQGVDIVGAKATVIRNNYFHDIRNTGVYPKGNAEDTLVENNKFERIARHGIKFGEPTEVEFMRYQGDPAFPYETYRARAFNNIIIGVDEACLAVASSYDAKFYNNSCYDAARTPSSGGDHGAIHLSNESLHPARAPSRNVEFKNNIIHARSSNVFTAYEVSGRNAIEENTLTMDNQVYWSAAGQVRFNWSRVLDPDSSTFDQWRSQTPHDDGSVVADPRYAELTELRLRADSPAIDRGTNNPCPEVDYGAQTTRPQNGVCDIGADEVIGGDGGDAIAPTASMTSPADGTTVSGVITVAASASDNVGVAGVQFLVDNTPIGAEDTTAPYSISYDTSALSEGAHTFSARARDAAGNTATATPVTVTVTSPPSGGNCVTATAGTAQWQNTPFASQTGTFTAQWDATPAQANMDGITALSLGPQTTWSGLAAIVRFNSSNAIDARNGGAYTAVNNIPYVPNSTYRIRMDVNVPARTFSAWVTPPGGSEQIVAQNYAFRTEQQSVTSLDNFNVEAEIGSITACNFTLNPTADTQAPTVSMTSPANGSTVSGSITLSADAADNVGVAGVQFLVDGNPTGAEDTTAPYSLTFDTTTLSEGTHTFSARARDAAGNTTTASNVTVTVQQPTGPGPTTRWENNDSRLTYSPIGTGHWSLNGSSTYASGGNYAVGNGSGAVLTFSFTGTAVKWIAFLDQYSGQARVTIDGVSETVDLYRPSGAPDFGWQQVAWQKSGLAAGTHNVQIEVLGTKNASSGGVWVSVDAFDITE